MIEIKFFLLFILCLLDLVLSVDFREEDEEGDFFGNRIFVIRRSFGL